MAFSSGAFGQMAYMTEVTPGVTPTTGSGALLRTTGPTTKAALTTTSSAEVRQDRLSTGLTRTDLNIDGGFNFEFSGKEYDPFIEGLIGAAFTHYGTQGVGTTFALTTAALLLTAGAAPTTTSAFALLTAGSWIKLLAPVGATAAQKIYFADAWFKVASTTTTTVVLDASTPVLAAGLGITGVAGFAVSQSVVQNGSSLVRSFTLEYALSDIVQFLPFQGMRANKMDLNIQTGSIITGSFDFVGMGHGVGGIGMLGTKTLPGTLIASQTLDVMNAVADVGAIFENGTSVLSAGSFIKSVKLSISNNMRGQKAIGVMGNAGVGLGELAIEGTIECYVQDAAYYNKWFAGTNTSLSFGVADSVGNGYIFDFEKVSFKDGGLNTGGQSADAMLTLPFKGFYNPTTGRGLRITRSVAA